MELDLCQLCDNPALPDKDLCSACENKEQKLCASCETEIFSDSDFCKACEDQEFIDEQDYDFDEEEYFRNEFQDPGGNSALRRATPDNPRNQPCPTCKQPNRLTPKDVALRYQCNQCADRDERGW